MTPLSPRTPLIAGNWKMHFTEEESVKLVRDLKTRIREDSPVEVVLTPPFPNLHAVRRAIGKARILLGAQDLHWEASGPFTGEVSASMLLAVGCRYVLVGHSERRQYFGETDRSANQKVRAALENHLRPILCIGEKEEEREAGRTQSVIRSQLLRALEGIGSLDPDRIVVAYEPVWAIGTGRNATVEVIVEVHGWIRNELQRRFPGPPGDSIRILYGGSAGPENIDTLMASPAIDGVLVGGASLEADRFARIINYRNLPAGS